MLLKSKPCPQARASLCGRGAVLALAPPCRPPLTAPLPECRSASRAPLSLPGVGGGHQRPCQVT
jgi:hypothetical protein